MRLRQTLIALYTAASLSACAGKFQHTVDYNPGEPLRVAVLPFVQVDAQGEVDLTDPNVLLDNVPLVSSKLEEPPPVFVQKIVQSQLEATGLDIVSPGFVSTQLTHRGYGKAPLFDPKKIFSTDPKALCEILFCDAVLYGQVTKWDRSYYGLQSVNTVSMNVKLVRAGDKKVIFSSSAEDSDSRGLTKGPTGFSSLVIEPIRGLDNEIISDLARNTAEKMLQPLKLSNRPEFLNSSPPTILASSHDARDGVVNRGRALAVLLLGTPKKSASFSIGNRVLDVPMSEMDDGHYVGEFYPLPEDRFENEPITVAITDEFGRTTKQRIAVSAISLR